MLIPAFLGMYWQDVAKNIVLGCVGFRYLSRLKVVNFLRCEVEKRRRLVGVRSFPYVAVLDVTNLCNLRCPYCPTGAQRDAGRIQRLLTLSTVDRMLEEMGDRLITVNLFNWGESLLHPQFPEIVRRFHSRNVFTHLSSNLSIENKALLEAVCRAGLDYLTVSTSGSSQETVGQYHRHSRISVVAENVRLIAEFKRQHRQRTPIIEWKYLMFKHNAHEVAAARKLAVHAGADFFCVVRGGGEPAALVGEHEALDHDRQPRFCHQLWDTIVVNSDNGIAPCYFLYFKTDDFADFSHVTVMNARNNPRYVTARSLFAAAAARRLPPDLQHPCLKCEIVHRVEHLCAYLASNPHGKQQARTGGP